MDQCIAKISHIQLKYLPLSVGSWSKHSHRNYRIATLKIITKCIVKYFFSLWFLHILCISCVRKMKAAKSRGSGRIFRKERLEKFLKVDITIVWVSNVSLPGDKCFGSVNYLTQTIFQLPFFSTVFELLTCRSDTSATLINLRFWENHM